VVDVFVADRDREMREAKLDRLIQWASIVGAVVTAASMIFGVLTYRRGVHDQRQAAAVGILQEYLKLAVEHPDLASRTTGQPVDVSYSWFATHALFTAETLWTLVGSDRRWQSSIEFVVRQHRDYLQQGTLPCDVFQPKFVEYIRDKFPELKCGQLTGGNQ
jgi:hypothetical protein